MRTVSLKGEKAFNRVFRDGRRYGRGFLHLRLLENSLRINRTGYVIPQKTIRNAVDRNRIRRLISESFRLVRNEIAQGYDIVFIVRDKPPVNRMDIVRESLLELFSHAGLMKKENEPADLI